jgi:Ni2+-binding GTPase involved in maturation of urease and hydrogenase
MKALIVKPIPTPSEYKHPPAPYDQLPTHEFTMGLIAPKGAGKTTVICNLLNFYRGKKI